MFIYICMYGHSRHVDIDTVMNLETPSYVYKCKHAS